MQTCGYEATHTETRNQRLFWGALTPLRTVLNYGRWAVCRYFCRAAN